MRLRDVIKVLHRLAPEQLAEPWDKVGLQVGDRGQQVRRVLLCIDLTEAVMTEAVAANVQLVVAYHPPIFEPIKSLTADDAKSRVIREAVRQGMAIYSPHTALDAAEGGVNDWLVSCLGHGSTGVLKPPESRPDSFRYTPSKIVTFVPAEHVDRVRDAMAAAGAGQIGEYAKCSFSMRGEGTFQGGEATSPAVGKAGQFERVAEVRLEMVCWPVFLTNALRALKAAHPYEEPAIDVYDMENWKDLLDESPIGPGRYVDLPRPISLPKLIARFKRHLGVRHLECAKPQAARPIRRVGVCAGAGGSLLADAVGLDAFVTGEVRHHDVLAAVARGITVILAGHTQTERPYLKIYRDRLAEATDGTVRWMVSRRDRPPSQIV